MAILMNGIVLNVYSTVAAFLVAAAGVVDDDDYNRNVQDDDGYDDKVWKSALAKYWVVRTVAGNATHTRRVLKSLT